MVPMSEILCGRNPVSEAIRAGAVFEKIYIVHTPKNGPYASLASLAKRQNIKIEFVSRQKLSEISGDKNPRGVAAVVRSQPYAAVGDILDAATAAKEPPLVILLDNIQDPHNLGAIIRTADSAGVHGVIIPKKRSAGLTGTVAKTSAGASAHMAVARVSNLNYTIDELKEKNIWFVGTDAQASLSYTEVDMTGPTGIVIGSEGDGMHRLVREKCDFLVKIPMYGRVNSLNASVAAGLLFYEARRQRTREFKEGG
jgi:23S rRNA (guanosine2251-2'-O)-methyltransferase